MTRRYPVLIGLLLATSCGESLPPAPVQAVQVEGVVEAQHVDKGEPIELEVRTWSAQGWTVSVAPPQSEGLTVEKTDEQGPIRTGQRDLWRTRYTLVGDPGSYIILPAVGQATDPDGNTQDVQAAPVFVDIGVQGPTGGALADYQAPPPPPGPPWGWIAAGGGAALLLLGALVGGIYWLRRPKPEPEPDPPHVIARRRWDEARTGGLDDHPLAIALSRVFREYIEATHTWPATARTGREILRFLETQGRLGVSDRMRAGRILDATDRLKFAREGGGEPFFAALDEDFAAVLQALRPHTPAEGGPSTAEGD